MANLKLRKSLGVTQNIDGLRKQQEAKTFMNYMVQFIVTIGQVVISFMT